MKTNRTIEASFFYGATPEILKRAKELRMNMTDTEKDLWREIGQRKLNGLHFRRQHPINRFIADFYCHEKHLVVEVDGGVHSTKSQKERDEERDYFMNEVGLKVLRFKNDEIKNDIERVISDIKKVCDV